MIIIKKYFLLLHLYIEYNLVLDIYYDCVCIKEKLMWRNNLLFLLRKIYIKIMRRKIVLIIKSLCGTILWDQPKVKKVSILYYSIENQIVKYLSTNTV